MKGSTTKGGRPREVPVRNKAQRQLLDEACRLVGGGALIPPERNYRQQFKVYEGQTRDAGLYRMHGLRHCSGCVFRWKAITHSSPSRSPIPVDADH